jgi:nitrile hydratase accessory protein
LSGPEAALRSPGLPRDDDGPVFAEPWQAQAFALTVELHAKGAFTWTEWAEALARELARDPNDPGARYYEHWVAALERLATRRRLTVAEELAARKADWAEAYRLTPHGQPVCLDGAALRPPHNHIA